MYKKAFTLIELIVVTSIIILLSTAGVFYFSNFIQTNEANQDIASFEDNLKTLDSDVKRHKILDYTLVFHINTLSYLVYKNIFFQDNTLTLDFDDATRKGNIYIEPKNV
jgi:prepilin-type N-terminal cleavage/methylation domain-containing protein